MKHSPFLVFYIILCLSLSACSRSHKYPVALERINYMAEENPKKAIVELDKLAPQMGHTTKRTRMRYELLRVKAEDKAYIPHQDESLMLKILEYFEKNGTDNERMEANYYMGSVYRDMHESPKAVVFYRRATDIAEESRQEIDPVVLSTIYAQLANIFYDRNRYGQAIKDAKRAYEIALQHGFVDVSVLLDLARGYRMNGQTDSAKAIFLTLRDSLTHMNANRDYAGIAELGSFFHYNMPEFEDECIQILQKIPTEELPYAAHSILARCWHDRGDYQMEEKHLKIGLSSASEDYQKRIVAQRLMENYLQQGKQQLALQQAERYIALTDSIQITEKLRETIQADNEYRYNQRAEKDKENQERASRNERYMWIAISLLLFVTVLGTWTYILMSGRLRERTRENAELRRRSEENERLLLEEIKKNNGQQLALKELVNHFRDAANRGGRILEERIWQQLYGAVEQENPGFNDRIAARVTPYSDEVKRLCHLFRAGLSQAEAARIMDFSSMTASRKRRKIVSMLGCDIEEA